MIHRIKDFKDARIAGNDRWRSRAFSLLEIMIAIVILGFGLVMVATMFPVAWGRAKKFTEATRSASIGEAAAVSLQMLARVDGLETDATMFAGDMVYSTDPFDRLITRSDTRVHYLNVENVRITDRAFVPDRVEPWTESKAPYASWRLGKPEYFMLGEDDFAGQCVPGGPTFCGNIFIVPQLTFESRVYPPLPKRKNVAPDGEFDTLDPSNPDTRWEDILDTRRYAWGVFSRLHKIVGPKQYADPPQAQMPQALAAANHPREFDTYVVTLRRPNPTLRYARQDPDTGPNMQHSNPTLYPYVLSATPDVAPLAGPPEQDVVLPEPWRVQIQLPVTLNSIATASGIPTEVQVPPDSISGAGASVAAQAMLADIFQRGTRFIDEMNGQVYRVVTHRLSGDLSKAFLTLDREIVIEDVNLPQLPIDETLCELCQPDSLDAEERLRTVWVFPPPVAEERLQDGVPSFVGNQPVIEIEIRPFTLSPG